MSQISNAFLAGFGQSNQMIQQSNALEFEKQRQELMRQKGQIEIDMAKDAATTQKAQFKITSDNAAARTKMFGDQINDQIENNAINRKVKELQIGEMELEQVDRRQKLEEGARFLGTEPDFMEKMLRKAPEGVSEENFGEWIKTMPLEKLMEINIDFADEAGRMRTAEKIANGVEDMQTIAEAFAALPQELIDQVGEEFFADMVGPAIAEASGFGFESTSMFNGMQRARAVHEATQARIDADNQAPVPGSLDDLSERAKKEKAISDAEIARGKVHMTKLEQKINSDTRRMESMTTQIQRVLKVSENNALMANLAKSTGNKQLLDLIKPVPKIFNVTADKDGNPVTEEKTLEEAQKLEAELNFGISKTTDEFNGISNGTIPVPEPGDTTSPQPLSANEQVKDQANNFDANLPAAPKPPPTQLGTVPQDVTPEEIAAQVQIAQNSVSKEQWAAFTASLDTTEKRLAADEMFVDMARQAKIGEVPQQKHHTPIQGPSPGFNPPPVVDLADPDTIEARESVIKDLMDGEPGGRKMNRRDATDIVASGRRDMEILKRTAEIRATREAGNG